MKQIAKESETMELMSCSARLKLNSLDVEEEEQPEDDGAYQLPTLFNLTVQR